MTQRLPPYLLAYNREHLPVPIVLGTEKPWMIGKIWLFTNDYEFITFYNSHTGLGIAGVPGYNICITFHGVLGPKMPIEPGITERIKREMEKMCAFFLKEQIEYKPSHYKKYLL